MAKPNLKLNVAGILRNRHGKILVCERLNIPGAWQFPQGGVDDGETVEEALGRELCEEIGIQPESFRIAKKKDGYRYVFPVPKKGHDGKDQTYFLCDYLGPDDSIDVDQPHPEFRGYQWIHPQDFRLEWLPKMKQVVYAAVFHDFFGLKL